VRSSKCAFAVSDALHNYFVLPHTTIGTRNCAVNMRSVFFGQLGSVFQFDGESVLHLDGSDLST